jgi:DNA-binding NarL/FixJ family response regulator
MIRILVADDHIVVREGVKQILSNLKDIVVEDEAGNGHETLEKVMKGSFDVILLDISMPGRGGLETLEDILRLKPRQPVLILSMHPEEQYAVRALRAGAAGYLTKASAAHWMWSGVAMGPISLRTSAMRSFFSASDFTTPVFSVTKA